MIVDKEIKKLISSIETTGQIQPLFSQLIQTLAYNCQNSKPQPVEPLSSLEILTPWDCMQDEQKIISQWKQYGFVIGKNVIDDKNRQYALDGIEKIVTLHQMNIGNPLSYVCDKNQTPILSRGFLDVYHTDFLAQIRQSLRLYIHHVLLWNTPFLWTTFDRIGIKPPEGESSHALPLHVDQNCLVEPEFKTIQGVLSLEDCNEEVGTFVVVPNSKNDFLKYKQFIEPGYKGEFVQAPIDSDFYQDMQKRKILVSVPKRCMVSWDSRTTHANSSNLSRDKIRKVVYVSTGIAKEENQIAQYTRYQNYHLALGDNKRFAYLHASKKPRFSDSDFLQNIRQAEQLNVLGQCLYGFKKYKDFL